MAVALVRRLPTTRKEIGTDGSGLPIFNGQINKIHDVQLFVFSSGCSFGPFHEILREIADKYAVASCRKFGLALSDTSSLFSALAPPKEALMAVAS